MNIKRNNSKNYFYFTRVYVDNFYQSCAWIEISVKMGGLAGMLYIFYVIMLVTLFLDRF